jgi:hypothetical protein
MEIFYKVGCTVVSMAQLHSCDRRSGVIKTTVTCTAVSLTQLWHAQRYHWHRCNMKIGVVDTLWYAHSCHWHCCDMHSECHWNRYATSFVDFLLKILSHFQKGVNPCIRGLGGVVWWKKPGVKILCQCSFKSCVSDCNIYDFSKKMNRRKHLLCLQIIHTKLSSITCRIRQFIQKCCIVISLYSQIKITLSKKFRWLFRKQTLSITGNLVSKFERTHPKCRNNKNAVPVKLLQKYILYQHKQFFKILIMFN